MLKPLTVWITEKSGKFLKRWECQTTLPASWEICMLVKKQQLELDVEQQTGSKLGKEYVKAVYCYPAYLTYMQGTSREKSGWMKHKLESRWQGKISITSDMQMTHPYERLWLNEKRHRDSWPPEEKNSIRGQRWGLMAQSFCVVKFSSSIKEIEKASDIGIRRLWFIVPFARDLILHVS